MFEMRTIMPSAKVKKPEERPLGRRSSCSSKITTPKLCGLLAEFDSATAIVDAARQAREAGYTKVDAYTPFPIHELDEALRLPRTKLPWLVLGGGMIGTARRAGAAVLGVGRSSIR